MKRGLRVACTKVYRVEVISHVIVAFVFVYSLLTKPANRSGCVPWIYDGSPVFHHKIPNGPRLVGEFMVLTQPLVLTNPLQTKPSFVDSTGRNKKR